MQNELLQEGLVLMLAGMGTVFVFLTVLVIAMSVMSRFVMSLSSRTQPVEGDEEVAAVAAAIRKHRQK